MKALEGFKNDYKGVFQVIIILTSNNLMVSRTTALPSLGLCPDLDQKVKDERAASTPAAESQPGAHETL